MTLLECRDNPDGSIAIEDVWFTQRSLKRASQIPAMVACLQGEEPSGLPPVVLNRCCDGEVIVHDGHHRVTAIWLSGRRYLRCDEYVIYDIDVPKRRIAKIEKFILIAAPQLLK